MLGQAASRIIEKLIAVYREQTVPQMVREFEQWDFSAATLKERWELLHSFVVIASYDRQPYTRVGGYELIWADEPGSLRRALGAKGLLDPHEVSVLKVQAVDAALADARFRGLSLQTDRGTGTGGTRYARTITEIAKTICDLHNRVLNAKTASDAEALFRAFDDIHGIGATIASKLCKYLLRELCLGNVPPSMLGHCARPILAEYHNSEGYKKLSRDFGADTIEEVLQGLSSSDDPYAIDAIFYINRFRGGNFLSAVGA